MGAASRGGSPAYSPLGGAGAVLEIRHTQHALGTNIFPGTGGWTDGGFVRYGGSPVALPGVNGWANGSGGATPTRGYIVAGGAGWKRARNAAAGNVPIDWYCGVTANPIVEKPAATIPSAFNVWEVGALMRLSATPAAAITRDCGLVLIMAVQTTYANCLSAGAAAGNDYAGFGVVYRNITGDLCWIVKKSGAGGGAPLDEVVTLVSGANTTPQHVKVRITSAQPGQEARVDVYVNQVLKLTRQWGAGTLLPVAADATFSPSMGAYRPMLRAAQETAVTSELYWRDEYVKAAGNAALLG